ncbi:MAG: EFR1 family ferrodoxin [Desulfobacterales bacterium]|nr:EFR1 family ferrodoxin [Desulfobacterales bacterium]
MKASILTFSQTGNTLKTSFSIGNGLQDSGIEVQHINFLNRKNWLPDDADIIGVGCPVFENRPAEVMPEFIKSGGFDFKGKKAFVFITSGGSPARSLRHLGQSLEQAGANVIGGVQLRGTSTYPTLFGIYPERPNAKDLSSAKDFGQAVAANIIHGTALPEHFQIDSISKGVFYDTIGPYLNALKKKATPLPEVDSDACTLCGNCVKECPSNSIKVNDKQVQFHQTCIVCFRCWHICPSNAISIQVSPGNGLIERLVYSEQMERLFGNVTPDEVVGPNLYKDVLKRKIKLKYDRKNPTSAYEYK